MHKRDDIVRDHSLLHALVAATRWVVRCYSCAYCVNMFNGWTSACRHFCSGAASRHGQSHTEPSLANKSSYSRRGDHGGWRAHARHVDSWEQAIAERYHHKWDCRKQCAAWNECKLLLLLFRLVAWHFCGSWNTSSAAIFSQSLQLFFFSNCSLDET